MRVTSAFNRLLALSGVSVTEVSFGQDTVTVDVALRRRRWQCPECAFSTRARYDIRPGFSCWRDWTWGAGRSSCGRRCAGWSVRAMGCGSRRCRSPGTVRGSAVTSRTWWHSWRPRPTRPRSPALFRVERDSVGRIWQRVVPDGLDPGRLDGLVGIGVDEVSRRYVGDWCQGVGRDFCRA